MQRELISLRILIEEYLIEDCWYNAPAERSLHVTYRFESCILQMKEESYQGYSTWFKAKIYTLTHITWLRVYHFPLPNNSTAETVCFLCVQSQHPAPTVHQSIYRIFSSRFWFTSLPQSALLVLIALEIPILSKPRLFPSP